MPFSDIDSEPSRNGRRYLVPINYRQRLMALWRPLAPPISVPPNRPSEGLPSEIGAKTVEQGDAPGSVQNTDLGTSSLPMKTRYVIPNFQVDGPSKTIEARVRLFPCPERFRNGTPGRRPSARCAGDGVGEAFIAVFSGEQAPTGIAVTQAGGTRQVELRDLHAPLAPRLDNPAENMKWASNQSDLQSDWLGFYSVASTSENKRWPTPFSPRADEALTTVSNANENLKHITMHTHMRARTRTHSHTGTCDHSSNAEARCGCRPYRALRGRPRALFTARARPTAPALKNDRAVFEIHNAVSYERPPRRGPARNGGAPSGICN
ncbi:hypothetical protein EVAR_28462_1 [Eumeta japonica]|uniref:Uncharacterized protein n=1 Tax=Eumeta variegata TaxID=151549 RepID=A0A4C1V9M6_EUMVA|nr:hypothetical protein EVAR_28462_1 [Eumeta japonica]